MMYEGIWSTISMKRFRSLHAALSDSACDSISAVTSRATRAAPIVIPCSSLRGEMRTDAWMVPPPLVRIAAMNGGAAPSHLISSIASEAWSSCPGTKSAWTGIPTASSSEYPSVLRAPSFQNEIVPSPFITMMASSEELTTNDLRSSESSVGGLGTVSISALRLDPFGPTLSPCSPIFDPRLTLSVNGY